MSGRSMNNHPAYCTGCKNPRWCEDAEGCLKKGTAHDPRKFFAYTDLQGRIGFGHVVPKDHLAICSAFRSELVKKRIEAEAIFRKGYFYIPVQETAFPDFMERLSQFRRRVGL